MFHGSDKTLTVACPACGRLHKAKVTVRRHGEFGLSRTYTVGGQKEFRCECGEMFNVDDAAWRTKAK